MTDPAPPPSDVAPLEWFLAERDYPCPRCEYSLRGLRASSCPECGVELALSVIPEDAAKGAYFVSVLGASVATSFFVIVTGIMGVAMLMRGAPQTREFPAFTICIAVSVVPLGWILRHRRWFKRRSRQVQIVLAICFAGWPPLLVAACLLLLVYW